MDLWRSAKQQPWVMLLTGTAPSYCIAFMPLCGVYDANGSWFLAIRLITALFLIVLSPTKTKLSLLLFSNNNHTLARYCQGVKRTTLKVHGKTWNWTPPSENSWTDDHQNLHGWLSPGYLLRCKISLRSDSLSLMPLRRFWRSVRQKTSRARMSLLGVQKTNSTFWPHFPNNATFWSILDGTENFGSTGFNTGDFISKQ